MMLSRLRARGWGETALPADLGILNKVGPDYMSDRLFGITLNVA
jgi:hypothetical protein